MSEKSFNVTIEPWSKTYENKEYQTPIFNLLHRKMKFESGSENDSGDFYVLDAPEWCNVLPITADKEVVLVEQYRYGIEEASLEIPGGMVDPRENPYQAIKRELKEETGYESESWQSLGKVSANPAIMTNYAHLFLAEDCEFTGIDESAGDPHERINVHTYPLEDFLSMVQDGTIHHTIVVATVAKYLLEKKS